MRIKKGTVNTCIFTLSERTTLDPVYYLFELTNSQDNTLKCFLATDIGVNPLRNNEFQIEETEDEDLSNGKISLELLGSYTYKIYEQSGSTNLDPDLSGAVVETGRVDLFEDVITDASFSSTSTIKVFNG